MNPSCKPLLLPALLWLVGCAHSTPAPISLDGAAVDDPSRVARLVEDVDYPLLLKGLDGRQIDSLRPVNPFGQYIYVMQAGHHQLWLKAITYGHPLFPEKVRCYALFMGKG